MMEMAEDSTVGSDALSKRFVFSSDCGTVQKRKGEREGGKDERKRDREIVFVYCFSTQRD